jgi:hypothetical protein
MRPRWILGLFLAFIVCVTIIWWPKRPMWTTQLSTYSYPRVLAFSEDNKAIFVLDEKRNDETEPSKPHLSRWDVNRGTLLHETPIRIPDPHGAILEAVLRTDGTALIVGGNFFREAKSHRYALYIIDTSSGQKRLGPIDGRYASFSPRGRWIVYHFIAEPNLSPQGGIEVIDGQTGDKVLRVSETSDESILHECFSPDDSGIALLVHNYQNPPGDHSIRIYELPGGKKQNHIPLAKRDWQYLSTWEGQHLTAVVTLRDVGKNERVKKTIRIDLHSDPTKRETESPELDEHEVFYGDGKIEIPWHSLKTGSDWKVEREDRRDPELIWLRRYWNKCVEWLGVKKDDGLQFQSQLRFVNLDTNRIRYYSPLFIDSEFYIAGNGACYAVKTPGGELSLWYANPFPRWPWAAAAGLGTLLIILLFGHWRYKRTKIA